MHAGQRGRLVTASQIEIADGDRYLNRFFSDVGGVISPFLAATEPYAGFLERGRRLAERAAKRLTNPNYIHFGLIDNKCVQADAGQLGRTASLNVGLVLAVAETFDRMMCEPTIYPGVGRPDLEGPRGEYRIIRGATENGPWDWAKPRCPVRRAFAGLLTRAALDFAVGHELAHITCNHWELGPIASVGVISEIRNEVELGGIRSQCLEQQADALAVLTALELADSSVKAFNQARAAVGATLAPTPFDEAYAAAFGDFHRGYYTVIFAVLVFFDLVDRAREKGDDPLDGTHPPPAVRAHGVCLVAGNTIWRIPYFNMTAEQAVVFTVRIYRAASHAVSVCTSGADHLVVFADDDMAEAYFTKLDAHAEEFNEEFWRASLLAEEFRWPPFGVASGD